MRLIYFLLTNIASLASLSVLAQAEPQFSNYVSDAFVLEPGPLNVTQDAVYLFAGPTSETQVSLRYATFPTLALKKITSTSPEGEVIAAAGFSGGLAFLTTSDATKREEGSVFLTTKGEQSKAETRTLLETATLEGGAEFELQGLLAVQQKSGNLALAACICGNDNEDAKRSASPAPTVLVIQTIDNEGRVISSDKIDVEVPAKNAQPLEMLYAENGEVFILFAKLNDVGRQETGYFIVHMSQAGKASFQDIMLPEGKEYGSAHLVSDSYADQLLLTIAASQEEKIGNPVTELFLFQAPFKEAPLNIKIKSSDLGKLDAKVGRMRRGERVYGDINNTRVLQLVTGDLFITSQELSTYGAGLGQPAPTGDIETLVLSRTGELMGGYNAELQQAQGYSSREGNAMGYISFELQGQPLIAYVETTGMWDGRGKGMSAGWKGAPLLSSNSKKFRPWLSKTALAEDLPIMSTLTTTMEKDQLIAYVLLVDKSEITDAKGPFRKAFKYRLARIPVPGL